MEDTGIENSADPCPDATYEHDIWIDSSGADNDRYVTSG